MVGLGSDINCGNDKNDVDHVRRQPTAYNMLTYRMISISGRSLKLLAWGSLKVPKMEFFIKLIFEI